MTDSDRETADTVHADQDIPIDWRAVDLGDRTLIVHDGCEGEVRAFLVSAKSRNVRTFAKADAVLYRGNVCEPVFDEETRTVEFYHQFAGRMGRASVAEWFDEPAVRLKELPKTDVIHP
jgi:hypothetical protein